MKLLNPLSAFFASVALATSVAAQEPDAEPLSTSCSFNDNVLSLDITGGTYEGASVEIDFGTPAPSRHIKFGETESNMGEPPGMYAAEPMEVGLADAYQFELLDQSQNTANRHARSLSYEFFIKDQAQPWNMLGIGMESPNDVDEIFVTDHAISHNPHIIDCTGQGELVLASSQ